MLSVNRRRSLPGRQAFSAYPQSSAGWRKKGTMPAGRFFEKELVLVNRIGCMYHEFQ